MVFAFFKGGSSDKGLDHIVARAIAMLNDARHSFDLASLAVLTDAGSSAVAGDVLATDERINLAEQELRSELIVHVSVQGSSDIGTVLGLTLMLKKIERIGDQAKNILDLAEHGVSLADNADIDAMLDERRELSELFAEAAELLADPDTSAAAMREFGDRVDAIGAMYQAKIDSYMVSDRPGHEVVPLAIYYRYLRRIVANLLGVVRASTDPVNLIDYRDGGRVDTDD
jgi:hypothetical protein